MAVRARACSALNITVPALRNCPRPPTRPPPHLQRSRRLQRFADTIDALPAILRALNRSSAVKHRHATPLGLPVQWVLVAVHPSSFPWFYE